MVSTSVTKIDKSVSFSRTPRRPQARRLEKIPPLDTKARILSVDIAGYRSCLATSLELHPHLSVLIGINGAGKTSILQALKMASIRAVRASARAVIADAAASETMVTVWFEVSGKKIGLRLQIWLSDSGRSTDEVSRGIESWNFQGITGSKTWKFLPTLMDERIGMREYQDVLFHYNPRLLQQSSKKMIFDFSLLENAEIVSALNKIREFRAGITYYSAAQFTDPARCPSSFEVDETGRIASSGVYGAPSAHLKFIYDLYGLKRDKPEEYASYCSFVARGELGLISRVTWKEIELSSYTAEVKSGGKIKKARKTKTLVIPKIQMGSAYITFNQLSEGTFKTLALIFYIMTDASSFLMIEEPEVCVHHGLLTRVVGTIKSYAANKQIMLSTHSDLLVDQLEPENVFVVEHLRRGTTAKPLQIWAGKRGAEALTEYLSESGTLGEYWRSGGLS